MGQLSDQTVAAAIDTLALAMENHTGVVPPRHLRQFLADIGADKSPRSSLGATISDIIDNYISELAQKRNPYVEDSFIKPTVLFYDLASSANDHPVHRFVCIKNPSKALLYQIAKTTGISDGAVELCLRGNQIPLSFRSKDSCFFVLDELSLDKSQLNVKSSDLYIIINKNHTVVISQGESGTAKQILDEIKNHKLLQSEIDHPNHLLARFFGCMLHRNNEVIDTFHERVEKLKDQEASRLPNPNSRELLDGVEGGIRALRSALGPSKQPLMAMREKEALFGAPARDSIARYEALLSGLEEKVRAMAGSTQQIRNNWKFNQDERSNSSQQRLNIAVGLMAPLALASGLAQAFADVWTVQTRWICLGASVAVSALLLLGMRVDDKSVIQWFRSRANGQDARKREFD